MRCRTDRLVQRMNIKDLQNHQSSTQFPLHLISKFQYKQNKHLFCYLALSQASSVQTISPFTIYCTVWNAGMHACFLQETIIYWSSNSNKMSRIFEHHIRLNSPFLVFSGFTWNFFSQYSFSAPYLLSHVTCADVIPLPLISEGVCVTWSIFTNPSCPHHLFNWYIFNLATGLGHSVDDEHWNSVLLFVEWWLVLCNMTHCVLNRWYLKLMKLENYCHADTMSKHSIHCWYTKGTCNWATPLVCMVR